MSVCNHGEPRACEECRIERLQKQNETLERRVQFLEAKVNPQPKTRSPYDCYEPAFGRRVRKR